jgi:hypothetical protein
MNTLTCIMSSGCNSSSCLTNRGVVQGPLITIIILLLFILLLLAVVAVVIVLMEKVACIGSRKRRQENG